MRRYGSVTSSGLGSTPLGSTALVLSHGHWDHAGAMPRALEMIQLATGGRPVPTYMHPGMYRTRAMQAKDGSMRPFGDVPSPRVLEQNGAAVVSTTEPQTILDGLFYVSGEIPRVTSFETGMPGSFARRTTGRDGSPIRSSWTSATSRSPSEEKGRSCSALALTPASSM